MSKIEINKDWTFEDDNIAKNFDEHVKGQLPFYDLILRSISKIARNFVRENSLVYDIGCATGNLVPLIDNLITERKANYLGIDKSENIVSQARQQNLKFNFISADALKYNFADFDLCVINLVVMFMPIAERARFLENIISKCKRHGAIIITEKLYPPSGFYSTINNRLLWSWKMEANPAEEVIKKELSLEGIQNPLLPEELEPFTEWFRFGDFSSYIYINEN